MKPSRFETLKKKYSAYKSIYEKNKKYEDFANWFFEKSLLGFSYSKNLADCFGENEILEILFILTLVKLEIKQSILELLRMSYLGNPKRIISM